MPAPTSNDDVGQETSIHTKAFNRSENEFVTDNEHYDHHPRKDLITGSELRESEEGLATRSNIDNFEPDGIYNGVSLSLFPYFVAS